MKPSQLAPSMMCVDFAEMTDTLRCFEAQGIEYLHVDIMDGEFVSNSPWARISANISAATPPFRWTCT